MRHDLDTAFNLANKFRKMIENHFSQETALPGTNHVRPSSGQCAVASILFARLTGADCLSTEIDGISHWFNRLNINGVNYDIDITADQFGFNPVRIALEGELYPFYKRRNADEINTETLDRALKLAEKTKILQNFRVDLN